MPQLLALEWNASEARAVLAALRGESAIIEQAFSISLLPDSPGEDESKVDVGARIAAALSARGIGQVDTLVSVGRSQIELRHLSLPPAPDEELPELVRFQAMREFNQLDEQWLLDFLPIGQTAEGGQHVMAAAIGPEAVARINKTCEAAGLKPTRFVLRACAAASLWGRNEAIEIAQPRLLVDLLTDEADLTVLIGGQVVFLRTTRLGGDPLQEAEHARLLITEIRRTMAASQNQLGGQKVASIIVCGAGEDYAALAGAIEQDLGATAECFDPFEDLKVRRRLQNNLPDHAGRFTPLLGMVLDELEQTPHAIDLLNPRQLAKPPSRYKKFVPWAVAAAVLIGAFFAYRFYHRSWLEEQIADLKAETEVLDEALVHGTTARKALDKLEAWSATDVVWLDELRELSQEFPPAKEAMLTRLVLSSAAPGGKMTLEGVTETPGALEPLIEALRDREHQVKTSDESAATSGGHYGWEFKSSVGIRREVR